MTVEWNKVTRFSRWLALALFICVPLIAFYAGIETGKLLSVNDNASRLRGVPASSLGMGTELAATPIATGSAALSSEAHANRGLTYSEAVQLYKDRRIQFAPDCQVVPVSSVMRNGTKVMFDNRAAEARQVRLDRVSHFLAGYGFKIITLSSKTLPHTVMIDCGSGRNNGKIILQ